VSSLAFDGYIVITMHSYIINYIHTLYIPLYQLYNNKYVSLLSGARCDFSMA